MNQTIMNKPKRRNETIDLMKFVFILMIMCFHSGLVFHGGYIAVEFFFVVSGFLMAASMEKLPETSEDLGKETISFILHKAAGIFPYYLLAWILSLIITATANHYSLQLLLKTIFRSPYNVLMVEMAGNYDMGHRVQGSWYISAMLLAMLILFPLRRKNKNLFDYVMAPIFFLFFVGYCYQGKKGTGGMVVTYDQSLHMYNGLLRGISELSLGSICYRVKEAFLSKTLQTRSRLLLTALEWGGYFSTIFCAFKYNRTDLDLAMLFWLSVSITISFSGKSLTSDIISGSAFSFLGQYSLSIYLVHEVVKNQLIVKILHVKRALEPRFMILYFTISGVLGLIVWFFGKKAMSLMMRSKKKNV